MFSVSVFIVKQLLELLFFDGDFPASDKLEAEEDQDEGAAQSDGKRCILIN